MYNHHHMRELYLGARERERDVESIKGKNKHFREGKTVGFKKA